MQLLNCHLKSLWKQCVGDLKMGKLGYIIYGWPLTFINCFCADIKRGLEFTRVNWLGSAAGLEALIVFIRVGINSWSFLDPSCEGLDSVDEVVERWSSRSSVLCKYQSWGRSERLFMTKSGSFSSWDMLPGIASLKNKMVKVNKNKTEHAVHSYDAG